MAEFGYHVKRIGWLLPRTLRLACLILLAACLMAVQVNGFASAADQPDTRGKAQGFPTPEDAVRYFCEALSADDFEKAMSACAIHEQAEGYDFSGFVDRMKMHTPIINLAPSTSDLYRELNSASVLGSIANQMKMLIYSFLLQTVWMADL